MILLVVTWFTDLIWLIYWVPHWTSNEMKDWQKGVHMFVITCSVINFLMKIAIIIMLGVLERDNLKGKMQDLQKLN